jgi:splicing factor, arginine/serine-rich 16
MRYNNNSRGSASGSRSSREERLQREERRRLYVKRKVDPIQFLRVSGVASRLFIGNSCKDTSSSTSSSSSSSLIPWQGDSHNLIDRFDARVLLDYLNPADDIGMELDEYVHCSESSEIINGTDGPSAEDSELNFERYRDLVIGHTSKRYKYGISET